jgi:hypothetical protein
MAENDETVKVSGASQDNAVLLLAAAEELGLDPHVVVVEGDGFRVPKEVAEKADVDAQADDDSPDEPEPDGDNSEAEKE